MDIKWKKYSYSVVTKTIAFIIATLCLTGAIIILSYLLKVDPKIAFEDSYFLGKDYMSTGAGVLDCLITVKEYQSEENILNGGTLNENELLAREENLYREFEYNSKSYNPNLSDAENYEIFKEVYAAKIAQLRDELIKEDLRYYNSALQRLTNYQGLIYYAKIGEIELSKSPNNTKEYFQSHPSYMLFEGLNQEVFPLEVKENTRFHWVTSSINQLEPEDIVYLAFTEEYLNSKIAEWKGNKLLITNNLYQIAGLLLGLAIAIMYLVLVIGRKPLEDQKGVHLNVIDRIYNDINIGLCFLLIALWFGIIITLDHYKIYQLILPITMLISALCLILFLSLIKHQKNGTLIRHSLIYKLFHNFVYKLFQNFFKFIRDIYNSGSVGVKAVLIVIGYPIIVALTIFIFPITLGVAAWLTLKKVKEFEAIKEGVKQVKDGDIHHKINLLGDGELAKLAADINNITDGLSKAVESQTKNERLKAELITNVSHDIRTPLTSIITYVDLLKNEQDQNKIKAYLEILDQKSQRLKVLTDDLFEAAKASSGTMPVNFEKIDISALLTQGLGELNDKINECKLEFKIKPPKDKVYINADGKLFWRAVENLLSNIFKYALQGSRVYLDIQDLGTDVMLIIKNISACELNISADELMERFKRGDEARSSQGSGLGLSIAKSLIELQKGSFNIEIDGDLFKAVICMSKA